MTHLRILTALLTIGLCGIVSVPGQEMDKELSVLATKLAALTKENGKKKVTVLDFTDLQGGASELGKYIAEELTVSMVMVKQEFAVLDRANLRKILAEHKLTATGLVDPEYAKKLGQFAGVDALILGTIIPKNQKISLTAKIITTDTAEIVGAARAEFNSDETVQHLLAQAAKADGAGDASDPPPVAPGTLGKPFNDLRVIVHSLKLLPEDGSYGNAILTLSITNTSAVKTYGVGISQSNNIDLHNARGEEFRSKEIQGMQAVYREGDEFADVLPRSAIMVTGKFLVRWDGKPGDYRPYRLQVILALSEQENGLYRNLRTQNFLTEIK